MKLLFIENRYTTWVYANVARHLQSMGYEIHWLVQNPMFTPNMGEIHLLSFPKSKYIQKSSSNFDWLTKKDRGIVHFKGNNNHYGHYEREISKYISCIKPLVVFGEATQFHELLAIKSCKEMGILYLSPNGTRYPPDRTVFYAYDTLVPVGGDERPLNDFEIDRMLCAIRDRKVIPSYMKPSNTKQSNIALLKSADKIRILWGWLKGERYITPSLKKKIELNWFRHSAQNDWELVATTQKKIWNKLSKKDKPWVLYPLQMQPESNIDVWGSPWNNQTEIVRRAAQSLLPLGAVLVIKPNPKSKYEINQDLINLVRSSSNIIALSHKTQMINIFTKAPLVMTVTGTVLIERIFFGKPVACLGNHEMTNYPGVYSLNTPEDICDAVKAVIHRKINVATQEDAKNLLKFFYNTSYKSKIWDPIINPENMSSDNVQALAEAFKDVIVKIDSNPEVYKKYIKGNFSLQ